MGNEAVVSKNRLEILIGDAVKNKGRMTQSEILRDIGASLISLGLEAEKDPASPYYLKPISAVDFKLQPPIEAMKLHFSVMSNSIEEEKAEQEGREFWDAFKDKAVERICSDEGIKKLTKDSEIKDALRSALSPILAAMGLAALWIPAVAIIAVSLIMLLLDAGIESLCELNEG